jgi:hypothetical protein
VLMLCIKGVPAFHMVGAQGALMPGAKCERDDEGEAERTERANHATSDHASACVVPAKERVDGARGRAVDCGGRDGQ